MKIKRFIMLALCLTFMFANSSCDKIKPRSSSGHMVICDDTSINFYHTAVFSKNKKQEIILAFWDNLPRNKSESTPEVMEDSTDITCYLTSSNSTVKFKCVGKVDIKSGKGKIDINEESFDISNGRLFLINTHVKPVKVTQVNEQFNSPPFNDLSFLDAFEPSLNKKDKKNLSNAFSSCQEKFEYLAKNNKTVAAFLADSKKSSELPKNKPKDLKKKN